MTTQVAEEPKDYVINVCEHYCGECLVRDPLRADFMTVHLGEIMQLFCIKCEPVVREGDPRVEEETFRQVPCTRTQAFNIPASIDKEAESSVWSQHEKY
jgi:hypothetical protein